MIESVSLKLPNYQLSFADTVYGCPLKKRGNKSRKSLEEILEALHVSVSIRHAIVPFTRTKQLTGAPLWTHKRRVHYFYTYRDSQIILGQSKFKLFENQTK